MPYLETTDGTQLFYTDWGAGAPVVFVHSWGLNSDMWTYLLPDLVDAGLRCTTYDRRGHGRSDRPGQGYDFDTLADDLAIIIRRLGRSDVTLVGHSMGCGEIVRYLSRHGAERIARIALLAPTLPGLARSAANPDGIDRSLLDAAAAALKKDVPKWCADNAAPFFGTYPDAAGLIQWVTRQIVDVPLKILLDTMHANTHTEFHAELPKISLPTLILHGDADASAPIGLTGSKTAALIPGSKLVLYKGAGHGFYASEHARISADLLAFMSDC